MRRYLAPLAAGLVAAGALLSPAMAARPNAGVSLLGAGSTFDQPFFASAFDAYSRSHHISINYQGIGSGAGIQQFTAKTVDFGASDVPMDPTSELPAAIKAGGSVLQIPIALGGVAVSYNLPGVNSRQLRLTGKVLANIYLGLDRTWNAKDIKALNPRLKLPNMPIIVAHRSDASGTSFIFTDYLSKVSDEWRGRVGVGKLPNWPAGVGGKGNEGVAAVVQQQPGAIGYVELAYVLQNKMKVALVQNGQRKFFVAPTMATVAQSASRFPHVSAREFSIVNARCPACYPIVGYSWVLLYQHYSDKAKGRALQNLFKWMVTTAQTRYAKKLDYVPLPRNIVNLAEKELKTVK